LVSQTLALFAKVLRKISKRLINIQKAAIMAQMPSTEQDPEVSTVGGKSMEVSIDEELDEAGDEEMGVLNEKQ
jgi:N-acetyltransferase 10